MKKLFYVVALFTTVSFMACGNKTASNDSCVDTDTVVVDTCVADTCILDCVCD